MGVGVGCTKSSLTMYYFITCSVAEDFHNNYYLWEALRTLLKDFVNPVCNHGSNQCTVQL